MAQNWNDKNGKFNPVSAMDYLPREQLKFIQSQRLSAMVEHAYNNVALYRERMDAKGVKPSDIKSIDDISKLPFTQKTDLRDTYPYGLFAVPTNEVVRLHASSGTTGKPIVVGYTEDDMDVWKTSVMRCLLMSGINRGDFVQICYGYGLFTGGAGLNDGAHKLGAMTVPMSSGNTDRQLQFMEDMGVTVLCCTPSYASFLGESAIERGIRDKLSLRAGIFGAEAWTEEMRRDIEDKLQMKAYDIYGLTEISGPGVAFE